MPTFLAALPALLALLATSLTIAATPSPSPTSAAIPTVTPPSSYYLKSRVILDHGPNSDKDGLYVSNFHTGAGTADLTLLSIDDASLAFFDSGYQEFNLNPPEPFGVVMGQDDNGWNLVSTAPGYGDGGFFFNASGLQYDDLEISGIGWGGWIGVLFTISLLSLFYPLLSVLFFSFSLLSRKSYLQRYHKCCVTILL